MDLSFDKLYELVCHVFDEIPDHRRSNYSYSLTDMLKSGFAIFSIKSSSLLDFKNRTTIEDSNLMSIFKVSDIPSDNCFRQCLDNVDPLFLKPIFRKLFDVLQEANQLDSYLVDGHYLLSIDGVNHFHSSKVHCDHCLVASLSNGIQSYKHSMLAAVLVHPDEAEVFPMDCEPIVNTDGFRKNDCEMNACKRLLANMLSKYPEEKFIVLADALFSVNPHIKQILSNGWQFIIGVKPGRNKALFKLKEARKQRDQLDTIDLKENGISYRFTYMNNVALADEISTVRVNLLCCEEQGKKGKIKKFSWVTNRKIGPESVMEIMRLGRSRWKVENETFNTLKNQGYHFEHNFGHGKNQLCTNLAYLMFLAFFVDQIQQRASGLFKVLLQKIKQKKKLWQSQRSFFSIVACASMEILHLKMAEIWGIKHLNP